MSEGIFETIEQVQSELKNNKEEAKSPADESKKNAQSSSSSKDEVGLKPGETSGPK